MYPITNDQQAINSHNAATSARQFDFFGSLWTRQIMSSSCGDGVFMNLDHDVVRGGGGGSGIYTAICMVT